MLRFINEHFSISCKIQPPSYTMKNLHHHNIYELFYMNQGSCSYSFNNTVHKIENGTFVLIPPGCSHKSTYLPGSSHTRTILHFTQKDYDFLKQFIGEEKLSELFIPRTIAVPKRKLTYAEELLKKIAYEYNGVDNLSEDYRNVYFIELILFLIRCLSHGDNISQKMDVSNTTIQQAIDYIYGHFSSSISVDILSQKLSMSETTFSKKFKLFTGVRFKDYLIRVRIHAAEDYLSNTDKTITEISELCGFGNSHHLSDTFKRIKGISPKEYRKIN